jgi:hypothetical protein
VCTSWSACVDGQQARTCSDRNTCGSPTTNAPANSQICQVAVDDSDDEVILPDEDDVEKGPEIEEGSKIVFMAVIIVAALAAVVGFVLRKRFFGFGKVAKKKGHYHRVVSSA